MLGGSARFLLVEFDMRFQQLLSLLRLMLQEGLKNAAMLFVRCIDSGGAELKTADSPGLLDRKSVV